MNKLYYLLIVCVALVASCANNGKVATPPPSPAGLQALHGSALDGVALLEEADSYAVHFEAVRGSRFVRVPLDEASSYSFSWDGNVDNCLSLAAVRGDGVEVGVVALHGAKLDLVLTIAPGTNKTVTVVREPLGAAQFEVTEDGFGGIQASWVENLPGDYNFDGSANLSDLTSLAAHLGESVERQSPGAPETTEYWIDGTADGLISISDVTPLGANFGRSVHGFKLHANGMPITNEYGEPQVITRGEGQPRAGLPPVYNAAWYGWLEDSWEVRAVESDGDEWGSAFRGGGELELTVNIQGLDLLAKYGGTGVASKMSTRVIDPIEIIYRARLPLPMTVAGNTFKFRNVPRNRTLFLDVAYAPVKNLATGKTASLADPEVVTAIPFELPYGFTGMKVDASIRLEPNPKGGYFVKLETSTSYNEVPGYNGTAQLAYAAGELQRDLDFDGKVDSEFSFVDDDRDCVSNQYLDYVSVQPGVVETGLQRVATGTVGGIDVANGTLHLIDVQDDGQQPPLGTTLTLRFNEYTLPTQDALEFQVGDLLTVVFDNLSPSGDLGTDNWLVWLWLVVEDLPSVYFTGSYEYTDRVELNWSVDATYEGFVSFRLVRYGYPYVEQDPRGADAPVYGWYPMQEDEFTVAGDQFSYVDYSVAPDSMYAYDLYGLLPNGNEYYLASTDGWTFSGGGFRSEQR